LISCHRFLAPSSEFYFAIPCLTSFGFKPSSSGQGVLLSRFSGVRKAESKPFHAFVKFASMSNTPLAAKIIPSEHSTTERKIAEPAFFAFTHILAFHVCTFTNYFSFSK
jgi:hypothetical protein